MDSLLADTCASSMAEPIRRSRLEPFTAKQRRLPLEAQGRDEIAALVLDGVGTSQTLQRLLCLLVAERRGALVIGFCHVLVLWPTAARFRELAHLRERAGMVLRGRLLEQGACAGLVLRSPGTLGQHQAELILRLRIGLCRLRQQISRACGVRWRACTAERREIGDAARVAG